jgi:hypothetical protein
MGRKAKKTIMGRKISVKRMLKKNQASPKIAPSSVLPPPQPRGRKTQPPRSYS